MCDLYTEAVLALENCDHVFHKECLLEYLKNKVIFSQIKNKIQLRLQQMINAHTD